MHILELLSEISREAFEKGLFYAVDDINLYSTRDRRYVLSETLSLVSETVVS